MPSLPLTHPLALAATLLAIGLLGLLARRNLVFMLLAIEIMLNAAGLAFVAGGARWGQSEGQVMFILVLTVAAAEVCVGLGLILAWYRRRGSLDADAANHLRG